MPFTGADITGWVGAWFWPFARIGAVMGTVPVLGSAMIPMRTRLIFALLLTVVIAPLLGPAPKIDPLSGAAVQILVQQVIIGLAIGLALRMVFGAFIHGGQVIAMQMGLGFASVVDPQNGVQVPVVSQFYLILVTLIFLAIDGHLALIQALVDSFTTLPVSTTGLSVDGMWTLVGWAGAMFGWATLIALPAVTALLVANVAFGVAARAAPQFNLFSVGFPVTMTLGFVVILMTLHAVVPQFLAVLGEGFTLVRAVTQGG
jgi:flagellar biosynthetic protein FliR